MADGLLARLTGRTNGQERKQLTQMLHAGSSQPFFFGWSDTGLDVLLPATRFDYASEVGDMLRSNVVTAPLSWMMRTFPEAPPVVERRMGDEWHTVLDHSLARLLGEPNPFQSGEELLMATVMDFCFGDAYWVKIRNRYGDVVQLWWVPRQAITPKWPDDGSVFVSHYEYHPQGRDPLRLETRDVCHFRFGQDPRNPRRGFSPLAALVRDVFTDDQAANFSAAILKNLGIIGVVISPKEGVAKKGALDELKEYIRSAFTGDKRGDALAIGAPTDVEVLQYNLQGFDMGPIRDVVEERVCAAMGIPAAVVGFGTGLQQTKVGATMKELRQLAWTGGIIPLQRIMAAKISRDLLPEFQSRYPLFRVRFDTTQVRALWEDANEKHDRIRKDVQAGILTVAQAQKMLGYPIDEDRDVYLQPGNLLQLSDGETIGLPPPPASAGDDDDE